MSEVSQPLVIGIAGGTGSGKTTIAKAIFEELPVGSVAPLQHDAYYRDRSDVPEHVRRNLNFDHPDALDNDLLIEQIGQLSDGVQVGMPVYDFVDHRRTKQTIPVAPAPVIMVEGILIFVDKRLRERFDIKLYVDTPSDIRVLRRIRRDMIERGRTFESIREQYYATVRPMHEAFVEPTRRFADMIVPEGGTNLVAVDMITARIRRTLRDRGWQA
jgi:uridine kinase